MTLQRIFISLFFAMIVLVNPVTAWSATGDWVRADASKLRLISSGTAVGQSGELRFGLEFKLDRGWKIYWRSPGDAGFPPRVDWSRSENVSDIQMAWPVPSRFKIFDIGTLGYEDHVVFPLTVALEKPGQAVFLAASVDYLICSDICIPGHADLSLSLPEGAGRISNHAHLIDRFSALVPVKDTGRGGLHIDAVAVLEPQPGEVKVSVAVERLHGTPFTSPDIYLEGPHGAYFDEPSAITGEGSRRILEFEAPSHLRFADLTTSPLTITLVDGQDAVEATLQARPGILPQQDVGQSPASLWTLLLLAIAGGLVLNLMPCVLPVLSLKLLSVLQKSGKERRDTRTGFLASAAGILFSFFVLAGAAVALKLAGVQVGWGIQFQQPLFLSLMVALLTLFACNLAGFFEFQLPSFLGNRAATAESGQQGFVGDFITGAFATLLATPCTAPFLGTAVGFAFAAGAIEIFAVFLALGIGLALPYLAIAMFPNLIRYLPKPGRWMICLKALLALALAGTALWLLSVLAVTIGTENAIATGALSAVAAAVLVTRKLPCSKLGRWAWPLSATLACMTVISPVIYTSQVSVTSSSSSVEAISWKPFDEARIAHYVAEGKTVLVDVTADWCITCKWNKQAVLETSPVMDWLQREDVIAMQADWTRPNPDIAGYLEWFGRYGIPFNTVYGPTAPQGIPLPELLSSAAVLDAARKADTSADMASYPEDIE